MNNLVSFLEGSNLYPISDVAKNEWLDFAMYTVEARAIPNMIDGLKPVQRFYLYSSIKNSKKDFKNKLENKNSTVFYDNVTKQEYKFELEEGDLITFPSMS